MTETARAAAAAYHREYMREYRANNAERIRARQREWRKNNPEKVREYQERYWAKKFAEKQT